MDICQRSIKKVIVTFLFISLHSFAGSLPDELLEAPIYMISGETHSLAEYQGEKPVYVKFWATWCQTCLKQMPHFEHVQEQYGNKIEVIGINLGLNDDINAVKNTIEQFGLTMPIAIDKDGDLAQKFRLIGTPYHLLFDKNMNLVHRGYEADSSLDNKLELISHGPLKEGEIVDSSLLLESEDDISIDLNDGKLHALFFTATWCDWYLKDSRPLVSEKCVTAQNTVNAVFQESQDIAWLEVISRLWTNDKDLAEYKKKYSIALPTEIDKSNRLFHKYTIQDIPTLLIIKNDQIVDSVTDFTDTERVLNMLTKSKS